MEEDEAVAKLRKEQVMHGKGDAGEDAVQHEVRGVKEAEPRHRFHLGILGEAFNVFVGCFFVFLFLAVVLPSLFYSVAWFWVY